MVAQGVRDAVRHNFQYRCGYCGVQEDETGSLLEIDHYQPRSTGGGDEMDNLIVAQTAIGAREISGPLMGCLLGSVFCIRKRMIFHSTCSYSLMAV